MPGLLLHAKTAEATERFLTQPAHALLIQGQFGAGKVTLARHIAARVLGVSDQELSNYPYIKIVSPVHKSISIEAVRGLHEFMRLKTTGRAEIRRVVIVEDAHNLTTEAQNAFLKLLEEPPSDTVIILTASGEK